MREFKIRVTGIGFDEAGAYVSFIGSGIYSGLQQLRIGDELVLRPDWHGEMELVRPKKTKQAEEVA